MWGEDDFLLGFEDNQVGIAAFRYTAFARVASSQSSRFLSHPSANIGQTKSPPAGLRPHNGERQRKTRDATPCCAEVPLLKPLHCGRTARMIGRDHIDDSVFQPPPQLFALAPRANRRRTFTQCRPVWNFFRTEIQIVRTSFNTYRKPLRPGRAQL